MERLLAMTELYSFSICYENFLKAIFNTLLIVLLFHEESEAHLKQLKRLQSNQNSKPHQSVET